VALGRDGLIRRKELAIGSGNALWLAKCAGRSAPEDHDPMAPWWVELIADSTTCCSTERRILPDSRSSPAWRLMHCQSGLARGLCGR